MTEVISSFEQNLAQEKMPAGKKKVLIAAIHLFAKQGFTATTTAQIAKEAGVSEGTIYKYFPSKRELLNHLIAPMFERIRDSFFTELASFDSLSKLVDFIIKNRIKFANDNLELIKITLQEILTSPKSNVISVFSNLVSDGNSGLYARLTKIKQDYPEINQDLTPPQMMQIFLGPLIGYLIQTNLLKMKLGKAEDSYRIMHHEIYAGLTQK